MKISARSIDHPRSAAMARANGIVSRTTPVRMGATSDLVTEGEGLIIGLSIAYVPQVVNISCKTLALRPGLPAVAVL